MKMSKENYEKFKKWYDYTVENASDAAIEYLMFVIAEASLVAAKKAEEAKKNGKN